MNKFKLGDKVENNDDKIKTFSTYRDGFVEVKTFSDFHKDALDGLLEFVRENSEEPK